MGKLIIKHSSHNEATDERKRGGGGDPCKIDKLPRILELIGIGVDPNK